MKEHMEIVWIVVFGLVAGTIFSCSLGFLAARWLARLTTTSTALLVPVVIVLILAGAFAIRQNFWDIGVAICSGIFGYFLTRHGFSLLPLIIGFILGSQAERAFIQSLHISEGSLLIFTQPVALSLFLAAAAVGLYPALKNHLLKREAA